MRAVRWVPWLLLVVAVGVAGWIGWDAAGAVREANEPGQTVAQASTTTVPPTTTTSSTTTSTSLTTTTTMLPPTTTVAYPDLPEGITEPTGEVTRNDIALPLGLFFSSLVTTDQISYGSLPVSVRLLRRYETLVEDFQGASEAVVSLDFVVGEYSDGTPIVVTGLLGRPDDAVEAVLLSSNDVGLGGGGGGCVSYNSAAPVAQVALLLDELLEVEEFPQVGVIVSAGSWLDWEPNVNHGVCVGQMVEHGRSEEEAARLCSTHISRVLEREEYLAANQRLVDILWPLSRRQPVEPGAGVADDLPVFLSGVILTGVPACGH